MTLPPWKPVGDEQIAAFTAFVIDELDRLHSDKKREIEAALDTKVARYEDAPESIALLGEMVEHQQKIGAVYRAAREVGFKVIAPKKRGARVKAKAGVKKYSKRLQAAIHDVEAMKDIFKNHWGKNDPRRTAHPRREEIAGQRWKLSNEDQQRLEDHFAK